MNDNPRIELVQASQLTVDPRVQRSLDRARARRIADTFDRQAFGFVHVSRRADGSLHLVDGQHRVEALRMLGNEEPFSALVYYGLTLDQEARLFLALNEQTAVKSFQKFLARIIAGEPVAVGINEIVARCGLKLVESTRGDDGRVHSTAALERVYLGRGAAARPGKPQDGENTYPGILEKTLQTIIESWGPTHAALQSQIIESVGIVFHRYPDTVEPIDLIDKLAKYPGGPNHLIGTGRAWRDVHGGTVVGAIADVIVQIYNKHRRSRRLEPIRRTRSA